MRMAAIALAGMSLAFAAEAGAEPKLDLNRADAAALQALPGIGPATAQRIVRIRLRNGPYRCVEELRAVPRVTEAQYAALSRAVYVERADPGCAAAEKARRAGQPLIEPR